MARTITGGSDASLRRSNANGLPRKVSDSRKIIGAWMAICRIIKDSVNKDQRLNEIRISSAVRSGIRPGPAGAEGSGLTTDTVEIPLKVTEGAKRRTRADSMRTGRPRKVTRRRSAPVRTFSERDPLWLIR